MKNRSIAPFVLSCCLLASSTFLNAECKQPMAEDGASEKTVLKAQTIASSNSALGFDLLHSLSRETPNQNLFISPLSIGTAFAMAYSGSRGSTQTAMQKVLHLPAMNVAAICKSYKELLKALSDPKSLVRLEIANAIFANKLIKFDNRFVNDAKNYFGSEVSSLDFATADTLTKMNAWVKEKTHGKITKIIEKIDPNEVSVLLNAAYFKGQWLRPFRKGYTRNADFHQVGGKTKSVPTMKDSGFFSYCQAPTFQAVALPYQDGRYSAYVFLPNSSSSVADLQKTLSLSSWMSWMPKFQSREGDLSLPRFKVEYSTSLSKAMKGLGLEIAFEVNKADFSGMLQPPPPLFIGDAKHKTYLKVDEYGTEAAAVTAIEMMGGAMMPPEDKFKMVVDRPFLFAIRDEQTDSILFIGCIYDPT